jgi:hypothetical protein
MSATCFGFVAIADQACRCGQSPRAVFAMRTREEGPGLLWLCGHHGDELAAKGLPVQSLTRTCGADNGGDAPCGAPATQIAILGVPGRQGVHAMSVCPVHMHNYGRSD